MEYERFTDEKGYEWIRRLVAPEDRMRWAQVPVRFWRYALAPDETESVKAVRGLIAPEPRGCMLVLSGGTGCGKSTAAAWALGNHAPLGARWKSLPRPGLWVHAPDLAKPEVANVDEFGVRKETLDERMRACSLLVLDDVGIEHSPSGYAASRITDILEHREANEWPSLVTTNLTAEQFRNKYGQRLASRLNGDALGWQQIAGADLRVARPHFTETEAE